MSNLEKIGERLRKFRGKRDFLEVCEKLEININHLYAFEKGFRLPTPKLIKTILEHYGKTPTDLYKGFETKSIYCKRS